MKVLLTKNLYSNLGLINNTIGSVHNIVMPENKDNINTVFIKPPLLILADFNDFIQNHKSFKNIEFEGLPKNIVPIAPMCRNFEYKYKIDGLQHSKRFSIKRKQIPLNPAFCLTNYKEQGESFHNLIVDFYNPPDKHPITMHNIYVTLSRLHSISGLIILRDVKIKNLQNSKYCFRIFRV